MNKILAYSILCVMLTACGSTPTPNLVHTTKPILNMEANLVDLIDASAEPHSARIKNKSAQPVSVAYHFFWYDKNGVTQNPDSELSASPSVSLMPQQQTALELRRPTADSVNYRLYLRLK